MWKQIRCPGCGASFTTVRGLIGHTHQPDQDRTDDRQPAYAATMPSAPAEDDNNDPVPITRSR